MEVRLPASPQRQGDLITPQRNDSQVLERDFSEQLKIYISKELKKGFTTASFSKGKALKKGGSGV